MNITNFLFAEPLIVEAVRARVPAFKSVGTWSELPDTIEGMGATPAAYIIFEGSGRADSEGSASMATLFWSVAVPVNQGQTKAGQAEQRALAGELLAQVDAACSGLKLPGSKPLELYDGPSVRYYKGGQAIFFLTYAQHCPLLRR